MNGRDIGGISPHPSTDHFILNLEQASFMFSVDLVDGDRYNEVRIVPTGRDLVVVGNIWLHYLTNADFGR
jgi:hypothetical protein